MGRVTNNSIVKYSDVPTYVLDVGRDLNDGAFRTGGGYGAYYDSSEDEQRGELDHCER